VYSGGTFLDRNQKRFPRIINVADERYGTDGVALWGGKDIPAITWTSDRSRTLEIDVEVRFRMYLEGTGQMWFQRSSAVPYEPLSFEIPRWNIEETGRPDDDDEWRDPTPESDRFVPEPW
jgi:hypothetical protein